MKIRKLACAAVLVPAILSGCSTISDTFNGWSNRNQAPASNASSQMPVAQQGTQPAAPITSANTDSSATQAQQPKATNSLVIYLSSRSEQPGFTMVQQQGQTVYVDPRNTLLRSDLDNVLAVRDSDNQPRLNFKFSPQGTQKLKTLTQNNQGKSLTVTYKGKLLSIIDITSVVSQGKLSVPMSSAEEATRIEQGILDGD